MISDDRRGGQDILIQERVVQIIMVHDMEGKYLFARGWGDAGSLRLQPVPKQEADQADHRDPRCPHQLLPVRFQSVGHWGEGSVCCGSTSQRSSRHYCLQSWPFLSASEPGHLLGHADERRG